MLNASQIREMTLDELRTFALQKGRRGNASMDAKKAQLELVRRTGGVGDRKHPTLHKLSDESEDNR